MTRWTDAQTAELKCLRDEGWSAAKIGEALGFSRNAVCGRVHRLGWGAPPPTPKEKIETRPPYQPPLKARGAPPVFAIIRPKVEAEHHPVNLFSAGRRHCRFPLWEDPSTPIAEKMFCGAETVEGRSYCATCLEKLVVPIKSASAKAAA